MRKLNGTSRTLTACNNSSSMKIQIHLCNRREEGKGDVGVQLRRYNKNVENHSLFLKSNITFMDIVSLNPCNIVVLNHKSKDLSPEGRNG